MAALIERPKAAILAAGAVVLSCGLTAGSSSNDSEGAPGSATPAEGGSGLDRGIDSDAGSGGRSSAKGGGRGEGSSGASEEAEGGRPTQPGRPPFASGTRYCLDARECQEYECVAAVAALGVANAVCLASCEEGGCEEQELCLGTAFLPGKHCFATCALVSDCAYAFDCYRLDTDRPRLCLPTEWALELGQD